MKIIAPALLGLCLILAVRAQDSTPSPDVPDGVTTAATQRTPGTLDTLLGPIALYPDPLVALILPASTSPSDVVLASRYLDAKNDPAAVDSQPWSESVKALVHYPEVLKWMNDNLEWTQALGQAFMDQPADVMNSVQRLRTRAKASGALVDTPQQHVLNENGQIVIEPAQPDIVYVPIYDPAVVYVQRSDWIGGPFLTFGFGYPIGPWFIYDCDWGRRNVWVISRPANWRNNPQYWHHTGPHTQRPPGRPWHPPVNNHPRPPHPVYAHPPTPRPMRVQGSPTTTTRPIQRPRNEKNVSPSGTVPPTPPRAPHVSNENDRPVHSTTPAMVSPPAPTPAPHVPRPVVGPPRLFTNPTRPTHSDPVDRSHHPQVTRPPVHLAPPAPPVSEPATIENESRSSKQGR